jgi:hypothetical protein
VALKPFAFLVVCMAGWMNRSQQGLIEYLQEENHQGLTNHFIRPEATSFPVGGNICRRQRLGRLLNSYHREAAG